LSFYSYDKMCTLLRISVDEFILARDGLIEKDLIAFDGRTFQVLSLPEPRAQPPSIKRREKMKDKDPATIHQQIVRSLGGHHYQ